MARDNPRWGYTRIRGALRNLGHEIGRNTIKRILLESGFDPARFRPRGMAWKSFLKAHWGAIAATDFFNVEVLTRCGLIRYFVLFVIDLETRRVEIARITRQPDGEWMPQFARNFTARSPNLNAYAERFVRSIKSECLAQIIPLGEGHLRTAVKEYTEHYHVERNHQELENELIEDRCGVADMNGDVERHERLAGILNYYYRRAA